ncbi:DUF402 domain-containing protein [Nocardioides donggukensis]|uniref:DUF402 domain-containing protein n=1 Tax=Nocardioides donggukensis TaxID=2774019 RepID=A0A927K5Z1_9ACTN|nr:DUF402 domain-containing protein [Nocardioides donggukensis]MBD8870546.1 DUF402 domain-containing protein [Nocardioides donggukensis]
MEPGTPIEVVMTKWRDRPHWEFPTRYLGSDPHGDWLGVAAGTRFERPGAEYVAPVAQVVLVPGRDSGTDRGHLATFHAAGGPVAVYVDITTPPVWDGHVLRAVDLDLDVVRGTTGRVWVDDEDEFAAHRTELGYPATVVVHATRSCARVHTDVARGAAPYDGTAAAWLAQVTAPAT